MNQVSNSTELVGRETERFTSAELQKIKRMILGYGRFKATAKQIGIPETTLRAVIQRGYATPETMAAIRKVLN